MIVWSDIKIGRWTEASVCLQSICVEMDEVHMSAYFTVHDSWYTFGGNPGYYNEKQSYETPSLLQKDNQIKINLEI